MTDKDKARKKKLFLIALAETSGHIANACKAAGIVRQTAYVWRNDDADFLEDWENVKESAFDELEQQLRNRSKKSDIVLIFLAKTLMKRRGYIERAELDHTNNGQPFDPSKVTIEIVDASGKKIEENYNFNLANEAAKN